MNRFDFCVGFVLKMETSYNKDGTVKTERDPSDPGGTTRYGIDQRSHPQVDVANLTLDQAKQIYRDGEWTRCRCEELGAPWDLAVFDAAVNLGTGWAVPALQKTVGTTADGFIGPKTIAAAKANPGLVQTYLTAREDHYRTLRLALRQRYLKGWLNRVSYVRKAIA